MDFTEHWLEIVTAAYLVGMVLYGHHKGFIKLAVSLVSLVLTLAVATTAMPVATKWLKEKTPVYEMIRDGLVNAVQLDDMTAPATDGEDSQLAGEPEAGAADDPDADTPAAERIIIEGLRLPDQIKRALVENNNGEVYQQLGVQVFRDYVGSFLADMAIRVLAFALLFFLIYVVLHILVVWLDLVARLPILSGMNKIAGALLGGAEALIVIWIACLIFTGISGTEVGMMILERIDASGWLSFLYHNNMLSKIVLGVMGAVF